ncbi:peptidyl-dipeptidase Dcp [Quadrisphaera granulorum]|uniref:Peptidyl-dipeptidase Dcp n=1 Tax=Quadrisphaera granulorum TaxID=317664 RepID=A0A316ACD7_9ACTN|nr:M3 family metallopeptidase [Quadrisphaera granulorum]PWJ54630.1 peptidyl-dipeptidase Dcp [Quadrisphaera granulorum]SZE95992.1 peptidyl-dipeptidase Dcp [Quadrisphaera granulorum]
MLDPTHPLAAPSTLPHGLPPFDVLRTEHFAPALRAGMAQQRAEVEVIATDSAPAMFANTVAALEASGELLHRATNVFSNLVSSHSDEALRAVEAELAPELSAHGDAITLDPRLFARLTVVLEQTAGGAPDADGAVLDAEQRTVLERWHRDLARAGAGLDEAAKARLRELNGELSRLTTQFGTELLAATNAAAVHVTDESELAGLSAGERAAAAQAAEARGLQGWVLPLSLPTDQPVLASLDHRGLRERVFRASTTRGLGGEHDTRSLLTRIAALRAERAGLLGAAHHAEHVLEVATAPSVEAVMDLLTSVVPAAVSNARGEALELVEELRALEGDDAALRPWDWSWAAARVRARRFSLDQAALKPYFELDAVITRGVFAAATALYGLTFTERPDLPVYHPDVRTWEVFDSAGTSVGLFLGDFFARESKRGGAWMSHYVKQQAQPAVGGRPGRTTRPVVVNNLNVPRPPDGEPALLTPDEVETAFHEFGHALHGLLSDVRYPRLSGTTVPRDFVEFPSQVNEVWAWDPALLPAYARHVETGEPLPAEQVAALLASRSYGQGFATTEIVAAMLLDQAWHQLAPGESVAPDEVEAFEAAALERHGIAVELVPPRYRSTYFNHVFSGGYSAGYYSYLWSEVLDADTVEWFTENGGLRRENGAAFAREVLSRGGTVDFAAAYRAFRGRDPRVEPLLERRGLAATGS